MTVRLWVCRFPDSSQPIALPYRQLSWSDKINEPHQISFTLIRYGEAVTPDILPVDGTREIHVDVDGAIVASGILWDANANADTVDFTADGFLSYYAGRRIRTTATYTNYEQFDLVRQILHLAHSESFGQYITDPGVQIDPVRTDPFVLRTLELESDRRSEVLSTIQDLAEMDNGFDFQIDAAWQSDRIVKQFSFWHPMRGESRGIVLRHGQNCIADDWKIDGRRPNVITVFGDTPDAPEGQEDADMRPYVADAYTTTPERTKPAIEDIISDSDLVSNQACLERALGEADKNSAQDLPSVTLLPGGAVMFADVEVGDIVRLVCDDFYRFDGDCRVVAREADIDDTGQMTVKLELAATTTRAKARQKLAQQIGGIRRRLDRLETRR